MNTTKTEICGRIAKKLDSFNGIEIKAVIDAFLDEVITILSEDKRIEIRGFGSFSVKNRKFKIGRNPRTGVVVPIQARKLPIFKFSKDAIDTFFQRSNPQNTPSDTNKT